MASLDVALEVFEDLDGAGGGRTGIAGHGHEVHRAVDRHMAHQIGHKNEAALQHAHKDGVLAGEVLRDFFADLGNVALDFFLGDQNSLDVVFHVSPFGRD